MSEKCHVCGKKMAYEEHMGFYFQPSNWESELNDAGGVDYWCPDCIQRNIEVKATLKAGLMLSKNRMEKWKR